MVRAERYKVRQHPLNERLCLTHDDVNTYRLNQRKRQVLVYARRLAIRAVRFVFSATEVVKRSRGMVFAGGECLRGLSSPPVLLTLDIPPPPDNVNPSASIGTPTTERSRE